MQNVYCNVVFQTQRLIFFSITHCNLTLTCVWVFIQIIKVNSIILCNITFAHEPRICIPYAIEERTLR